MSVFEDQKKFMLACGQTVHPPSLKQQVPQFGMYLKLIDEEVDELHASRHYSDVADALIDILVVTIGAGLSLGMPMQDLWDEVMRSNMSKIDPVTGKVIRREDGKILKPEGYSPPNIRAILDKHGLLYTSASRDNTNWWNLKQHGVPPQENGHSEKLIDESSKYLGISNGGNSES